jgi:hypothetical protein
LHFTNRFFSTTHTCEISLQRFCLILICPAHRRITPSHMLSTERGKGNCMEPSHTDLHIEASPPSSRSSAGWAFDGNTDEALALFLFSRQEHLRELVIYSGRPTAPHRARRESSIPPALTLRGHGRSGPSGPPCDRRAPVVTPHPPTHTPLRAG